MTRAAVVVLKALAAMAVILATAWAAPAAWWSDLQSPAARGTLAAVTILAGIAALLAARRRPRALLYWLAGFVLFAAWWSGIEPSNQREWQADVAVLPYAQVNGDTVTVKNIRDFSYRTEKDFTPRYYDKTFDLKKLDSVDLIAVYWMGDAIAHVMMSFGFAGKDYLCLSIETRKAKGQEYSSLKGFFKQYEIIYVAADERDIIRLRTDYRDPPEDVYIYRTSVTPENARKLFMEYVGQMNALREKPAFYNTLTTNCTTNVARHFRAFGGNVRYNWKILLSGYAPQYAYEIGGLKSTMPFPGLRAASLVNAKARAVGNAPDFSQRIREGLPGMGAGATAP